MPVVIALVVTPESFPPASEAMPGPTSDKTTLRAFLKKIGELHGKAHRVGVMDRGIPTEKVLAEMRARAPPVYSVVGTPKGRLSQYEKQRLEQSGQALREGVRVKLWSQEGEWRGLAESRDRANKERALRRRQLKRWVHRLKELARRELSRDQLLLKLGAATSQDPAAWRRPAIQAPEEPFATGPAHFPFALLRDQLRQVRRRERRYLVRCNLSTQEPQKPGSFYLHLTQVEEAFKDLKDDLSLRPIFHQLERRIEAHLLVSFLASCLHVHLRARLKPLAPGLTPRSRLEKFAALQMLDVHFPTSDGRELVFCRSTPPEKDHQRRLAQWGWELPPQSPPPITQKGQRLPE